MDHSTARHTARAGCLLAILLGPGSSVLAAPPPKERAGGAHQVEMPARTGGTAKDDAEIGALLGRYVAAMQARDLAGLKAVWPGLSESQEQKVGASFELARSITVQLSAIDIRIDGSSAVAECRRRDRIVTIQGLSFQSDRQAAVRLVKTARAWTIESIQ